MKKRIIWIGLLAAIPVVILLVIAYCYLAPSTKTNLKSLVQETTEIPPYNCITKFYIDGNCIDWHDWLEDNKIAGEVADVLVVYSDRVYFVVLTTGDNGEFVWDLLSVNKTGGDPLKHLSESFGLDSGDGSYYGSHNCQEDYWESKNGFYHKGKITLTDHVKFVEYDIEKDKVEVLTASEYVYPENEVAVTIEDRQIITLDYMGIQQTVTPDDLKSSSKAFAKLMELYQKKTWDGRSRLEWLFANVQTDGENVYIICSAFNWGGWTYAVVFQYDLSEEDCNYCFYDFTIDHIDEDFYVVPVEK